MEQLTKRMSEQWNSFQYECWNNGISYNMNVGTMEQLQCECWNNGTTYNMNVGTLEQLPI